jgi:hypothetical protein
MFTSAFAGRSVVHRRITMSDKQEVKAFIESALNAAPPSKAARRPLVNEIYNGKTKPVFKFFDSACLTWYD